MPVSGRSIRLTFLALLLAACATPPAAQNQVPARFVFVTSAPDATSTPTPFQPSEADPSVNGSPPLAAVSQPNGNPLLDFTVVDYFQSPPLNAEVVYSGPPNGILDQTYCDPGSGWAFYTVQVGDTLAYLSQIYGVSVGALQQANCLTDPGLYVGQSLRVPFLLVSTTINMVLVASTPVYTTTNTAKPTAAQQASATRRPNTATSAASQSPSATRAANTASPVASQTATMTRAISTATATSTLTSSPTLVTNTATSTASLLPHETGTAAFPTPTSAYNQPGTYPFFGRCTVIQVPETTVTVDMCLVGVEVHQDGAMQFVVAWTAHLAGSSYDYVEISGAGNPGVYITDDLGNRYDFFGLWGIAAATGYLDDNETGYGAYIFPPAHPGATTFTFHDDYQGFAIGGLVLIK